MRKSFIVKKVPNVIVPIVPNIPKSSASITSDTSIKNVLKNVGQTRNSNYNLMRGGFVLQ